MNINNIVNEEVFNHVLDETYASISEVKELANDVVKKIAEVNFPLLDKNKTLNYLYGIYLNSINSEKYKELKGFIEDTVIYVYIAFIQYN